MSRRHLSSLLLGGLIFVSASAPSWAAGEPSALQSWLVENRGLLWGTLVAQLVLLVALGAWEALFLLRRGKVEAPAGAGPPEQHSVNLVDPFKTHVTSRRPVLPEGENETLRRARPTAAPPPPREEEHASTAPPASPPEDLPTVRGGRRLERIDSDDGSATLRRSGPPAPLPPPAPPSGGGDSWADALRRTTQESGERPQRRAVQIPPPAQKPAPAPPIPLAPATAEEGTATRPLEDVASPRAPVRTVKAGIPEASPPASPVTSPPAAPVTGEGIRMPAGCTRYAWDHALRFLEAAVPTPCRLVAGVAGGGGIGTMEGTLNLITPPPAAAEKRRGRGMKLSAGGDVRAGDPQSRTVVPASDEFSASEGVPGFTGAIRSTPQPSSPLHSVKRLEPPPPSRAHSDETTVRIEGTKGPASAAPEPSTPPSAPPAFKPPAAQGPLATPGTARRALDLPTRRIELGTKSTGSGGDSGETAAAVGPSAMDAPSAPEGAGDAQVQKENRLDLRKADETQKFLEIRKTPRARSGEDNTEPNTTEVN